MHQHLEMAMKQQTGSKLEKEYVKAIYCHPAYLTYMQNTSYEMPGWMKHKLESRWLGEISIIFANILKYADDTTFMAESEEELESFDESERGERKSWLKAQHSED